MSTKTYIASFGKIIARVGADVRRATTDDFIAHLEEHIEIDDDLRPILDAFRNKDPTPISEADMGVVESERRG
jgi:hypothetical protein